MYQVRVKGTCWHQLLHFGNGDPPGSGNRRVVVPRRLAIDEVALGVPFPCFDERKVAMQRLFHKILCLGLAVGGHVRNREATRFTWSRGLDDRALSVGRVALRHTPVVDKRANTGAREESRNPSACAAHPLCQCPHRNQLHLNLPIEELFLEDFILTHIRRDDARDLSRLEEQAEAALICADVRADDGEVSHS
eukprot:scaffold205736_cov32-Tisochrysis_lutea.AAC.7